MTRTSSSTLRAAIYARVSSDHQAQEETIESQLAALRERVASDGHALDAELCFLDEGVSGSTLIRPALERLRDMAYVGGFEKLYVHSPDRLARRYAYQVLLVDELKKHGVEIEFLNRAIGVSPEDDLLLQMQGMRAIGVRPCFLLTQLITTGSLHSWLDRCGLSILVQSTM